MKTYLIPALAALLVAGTAKAQDADAKKDLQSLQGTWKVISTIDSGQEVPAERIAKMTIIIEGNKLRFRMEGEPEVEEATFTLDPTKKPRAIDIVTTDRNGQGRTVRGIYKIEGNRVTLCTNSAKDGERPTEFASRRQTRLGLGVLERVKK
jgi:uncharacterized protein (TIGR03067 family)